MFANCCNRHFNYAVMPIVSSLREFMKAKRKQVYKVLQPMSTSKQNLQVEK